MFSRTASISFNGMDLIPGVVTDRTITLHRVEDYCCFSKLFNNTFNDIPIPQDQANPVSGF